MKAYWYKKLLIAISLLLCPAVLFAAQSDTKGKPESSKNTTSKSAAADIAKKKYGGKVLKIEELDKHGQTLYQVRLLLSNGRVKILTVDAQSGKII